MTRTELFYSFDRFKLSQVFMYKKDLKEGEVFEQDICVICLEKLSDSFVMNNFDHNQITVFSKINVFFKSVMDSIKKTKEIKAELEDNNNNYIRICCGHEFHLPCFKLWIKEKAKCPTCNQDIIAERDIAEESRVSEPRLENSFRVNTEEDIERQFQEILENQNRRPSRAASEQIREDVMSVGSNINRMNNSQNSIRVDNMIISFDSA